MGYYIQVERGVKLYVEDVGAGMPVLLVHGWPINHKMYEYQVNQLPKHGFRCIGVDLRGFGKSDRPWTGYSYNRMADDIRVVIDTLGLEKVRLVGFSMGGAIAIRYMSRHHCHRVIQLTLLSAAAPAFTQRSGYPYGMKKEEVDSLIVQNDTDRPLMLENFGKLFFASQVSPPFRSWFHSLGLEAASHAIAATAVSLRDEDLRPDLGRIHVPTFIFHGLLDKICPFSLALLMNKGIANSILLRFEKSGHGIFYDQLDLFNPSLLKVLRS
ncbi:alpha/beta hydrolase [Paenibacillus oenotherae]|uniref:Alpha/beta hydrolase n=1 Tax=Paenibacillus oenotherae TaxID=1435645 RepID=A0ABS7D8C2_9BACL|nr:alpha/beta hydrolase [Paenibacillus oenotherae]MBW7476064.1 alpha/beta hydrolase [Paenibacillus oenotherae]